MQVSLDKLVAPAPGLPTELSGGLAAQPRYDVSTSFSIGTSSESFSYGFTGSDSGISYNVCILLRLLCTPASGLSRDFCALQTLECVLWLAPLKLPVTGLG